MSTPATSLVDGPRPKDRLEELFGELSELAGQRNAIDGRLVEIVAEIDRDGLNGLTGARSVASLVAWKLGTSPRNAQTIVAVAQRAEELSRCTDGLREGRLSLDQVGVIAERGGVGSDEHYAQLAQYATVTQLRTATKLEPRPDPDPQPPRTPSFSKSGDEHGVTFRIWLPHLEAAKFEAGLASHREALIADWTRDHGTDTEAEAGAVAVAAADSADVQRPPIPSTIDAFRSLVDAGWDAEATRRPHGQHTTVVVHVDIEKPHAALHLGPALSDNDRRFLLCDATCEVWFERHGQPIGAGRTTRTISRRLRRALEHRDTCCVVPGCGATRGLHAHHIRHWEDGGATELDNLALVCPFHHRAHHSGLITITGPADRLVVTDSDGDHLTAQSLARPPTSSPPDVPPYPGPTGERADWWWYDPYVPPPPTNN